MGGGLGFQNRGFGEGCLATHGVKIDEHAGDIDHGAADDLLLLFGPSDAGIDELARGRRTHLLAVDEGGLRRGGHSEGAGEECCDDEDGFAHGRVSMELSMASLERGAIGAKGRLGPSRRYGHARAPIGANGQLGQLVAYCRGKPRQRHREDAMRLGLTRLAVTLFATTTFAAGGQAQSSYPCSSNPPNPYKFVTKLSTTPRPRSHPLPGTLDSHDKPLAFERCGQTPCARST